MLKRALFVSLLAIFLAGCQSSGGDWTRVSTFGDDEGNFDDLSSLSYYANDQLVEHGKAHFAARNFGKSYRFFKKATNVHPNDAQAWLGFAASADHLGRFDNADIAYRRLSQMIPNRPEYLNNVGYSYLLRGNLQQARVYFLRAYELDPDNEVTANNLILLRDSTSMIKRG